MSDQTVEQHCTVDPQKSEVHSSLKPETDASSIILHTKIGVINYLTPTQTLTDQETITALKACVLSCIERAEWQLILDLPHIERLNNAALECLLDIEDRLVPFGGWLKVAHAQPLVQEVLRYTGVCKQVDFEDIPNFLVDNHSQQQSAPPRLGDMLITQGHISEQQLEEVILLQNTLHKRMGQILLDKGWLPEETLLEALSKQLDLPFIHLKTGLYDPELLQQYNIQTFKRLGMLPLFKLRQELLVATSDPQNMPSFDEIEEQTSLHVRPVLACQSEINKIFNEAFTDNSRGISDIDLTLIEDQEEDLELIERQTIDDYNIIDEIAEGSPIIKLVNTIIQRAVQDKVSDIHIEPGRGSARVRYRIDGILYQVMNFKMELIPAIVSRLKVMANLDIAERRLPQDGRIQVQTQGRMVDLRFSSLPGLYGEKVVLRLLDKNNAILELNNLGMTSNNREQYIKLLQRPYGLILVTGPTGSGKTTSLYAAINHLNSLEKNIVTIEDPVEYQLDIINQNEVKDKIGLSFAKILRHVLRQDPDIVLVGEIRDRETAEIAVQAALTGHLVLSTLHTNNSAGAIVRMIDMGIEPYLLSSALAGVMAQRLVRTICPHCKTQFLAPPELCQKHGWPADGSVMLARGRGCKECYDSGYKSRIAIHELTPITTELQQLIIQNPSLDVLENYRSQQQNPSLFEDGLERTLRGLTTIEESARVINI